MAVDTYIGHRYWVLAAAPLLLTLGRPSKYMHGMIRLQLQPSQQCECRRH